MPESAILVPVPDAEPVVGRLRARLDRSASRGVPAHVTVLYPFVSPRQITPAVIQMTAAAVRSVPGFGCRFAGTNWFGEDVLWLAPEPAGPFSSMEVPAHTCPKYSANGISARRSTSSAATSKP